MKKLLWISALAAAAGLMPGLAAAQEVGKVLSSTPVYKKVTEPRANCVNDADGRQQCRTEMVTEDRQIGFRVVYEYAGRQHEVQLPFAPGATIPLEVNVSVQGAMPSPSIPSYAPAPVYTAEPQVIERVVRDRVYVESPYYYGPYYPAYYNPLYPVLGIGLGYTFGYYSHGWRGGYRSGHWGR
jgi:hypothetical protein